MAPTDSVALPMSPWNSQLSHSLPTSSRTGLAPGDIPELFRSFVNVCAAIGMIYTIWPDPDKVKFSFGIATPIKEQISHKIMQNIR